MKIGTLAKQDMLIECKSHKSGSFTSMASVRWQAATAFVIWLWRTICHVLRACADGAVWYRRFEVSNVRLVVIEVRKFTDELDETIPKYC
jgi:hypothetical protein